MEKRIGYGGIDIFKLIAAFMVVAIHVGPLSSINENLDFYITYVLFRVAVPFFLMVSGYFVLHKMLTSSDGVNILKTFLKKIIVLYLIATLLYIPINLYAGHFENIKSIGSILKMFLFDGTFYHLWYMPSVIMGSMLIFILSKKFDLKQVFVITLILYVMGLLGDSYYGVIYNVKYIKCFYDFLFKFFDYTRNGIFYAPIFLMIGVLFRGRKKVLKRSVNIYGLTLSIVFLLIEGMILRNLNLQRHSSMYIFLIPLVVFLFSFILSFNIGNKKTLRSLSMYVYIIHPFVIVLCRFLFKNIVFLNIVINNSILFYILVCIFSYLFSDMLRKLFSYRGLISGKL